MAESDCSDCKCAVLGGLQTLQRDILEDLARGRPLRPVMTGLCQRVEELAPGLICSVLSVDRLGRLHPLAAPSLPEHYSAALDGLPIGPDVGSCGSAAFRGEPVEVVDIATDPLWGDFKDLALPLGLRACWSSPIRGSDGQVIGTFAFYYRACRGASATEHAIVKACVHLCAIAIEQEETRQRIHRLAFFDALTGLPNRVSFQQQASEAVAAAVEKGGGLAIHLVDLDDFKRINDTLGHAAGDALLASAARRFSMRLGRGEMIARIGGDEFAVLQPSPSSVEDIHALATRLIAEAEESVDIDGRAIPIGVSIGVACAPTDGADLSALMKAADLALYRAKAKGRKRHQLYTPEIGRQLAERRAIERDLKRAVELHEFELHYQPIVDLLSGEMSGVESLIRWRHPQRGLVPPASFIPLAEETGLIVALGDWVLKEACAQAASLPAGLRVAVNLSPLQLREPGFALKLVKALEVSRLSPQRLELEITESALLTNNAATRACLRYIRMIGVSIALDDFGTGCSALSHLRAFPVDRIKIDRSFVQDIDMKVESAAIIRAVVGLSRELGVKTTAEGVETVSQLKQLRNFGCTEVQGYLISKPKPLAEFLNVFEQRSVRGSHAPRGAASIESSQSAAS